MNTPRDLAQKMAEKSDQELLAMFAAPDDWTAEALDSARAELRKRGLGLPPLEPERLDLVFDPGPETDERDFEPRMHANERANGSGFGQPGGSVFL